MKRLSKLLNGSYLPASSDYLEFEGHIVKIADSLPIGDGITIQPDFVNHPKFNEYIIEAQQKLYSLQKVAYAKGILCSDWVTEDKATNAQYISRLEAALHQPHYPLSDEFKEDIRTAVDALSKGLPEPKPKRKVVHVAQAGYIYLLKAIIPQNYYKIGLSKEPVTRIDTLGVKLPFPIEPVHQFPTNDMSLAEKQLHTQYSDKRINGEWFALADEDVVEICRLQELQVGV